MGGLDLAPLQQRVLAYNARTERLPSSLQVEASIVCGAGHWTTPPTRFHKNAAHCQILVNRCMSAATAAADQSSFALRRVKAGSAGWLPVLLTWQAGKPNAQTDIRTDARQTLSESYVTDRQTDRQRMIPM